MSHICPLFTVPARAMGASAAVVTPETHIPGMLHRVLPLHQLVPGCPSLPGGPAPAIAAHDVLFNLTGQSGRPVMQETARQDRCQRSASGHQTEDADR